MRRRDLSRVVLASIVALAVGLLTGCPDDDDDNGLLDAEIDIEEDVGEMEPDDADDIAEDGEMMEADADGVAADADTQAGPTAQLQVIHASPDPAAQTVDIYINDELALDDFEFLTATEFMEVAADTDLEVAVAPGDSESVDDSIYTETLSLEEDARRVAVAHGVLTPDDFQGTGNEFGLATGEAVEPAEEVALNVFHASPDAADELGGPISVAMSDGTNLVDGLAYGQFSGPFNVPAEAYTLEVQTEDGTQTAASVEADLSGAGGECFTVIAKGFVTPSEPDPTDGEAFGLVAFDTAGEATVFAATE